MTTNRPNHHNKHRTTVPATPQAAVQDQILFAYYVTVEDFTETYQGSRHLMQLEIFRPREITTLADVSEMTAWIGTEYHLRRPVVLGFTLLRTVSASQLRGQQ